MESNIEYWRLSLQEVLPIEVTDEITKSIKTISDMEYEYSPESTIRESSKLVVDKEKELLLKEINVLKNWIELRYKVDSVSVRNNTVELYKK